MKKETRTINLPLPLRIGSVNCYLIGTEAGYVLIDTGGTNNRKELMRELERAGCKPGLLKLIVLTHGDFDHSGNTAYLRRTFGGKIGMHADDADMLERGDMFVNRHKPNVIIKTLLPVFSGFGKAERCAPDVLLKDGDDLSEYGLEAKIVSIPGHSKGSIGILTAEGELFCGDLLVNTNKPERNALMDDLTAATTSIQKLRSLGVEVVYPGHGKAFPLRLVEAGSA